MKITKQELIELEACADGLKRFIDQTNDTDDSVEVISLVGGENTYEDLLWLAGKKFPKERIVRFACDCASLNIELIESYTNKYNLIVEFLRNPTAHTAPRAARAARAAAIRAANAAYAARAARAADAADYAAYVTSITISTTAAATYAVFAASLVAIAAADARDGNRNKVDELLRELFA